MNRPRFRHFHPQSKVASFLNPRLPTFNPFNHYELVFYSSTPERFGRPGI